MCVGMFMAVLDIQIVASSLPDIQIGLVIPLEQLSWVQTAYLMAEIVAIPLTGWLTRMASTRIAFACATVGFTVASAGCAAAGSFWSMLTARVVQGFFGGFLIPIVFSAIFVMFERPQRSRATMIAGILAMLAPTLGPTVGGFITERASWHWLFLINLPAGVAVTLLTLAMVRIDRGSWREIAGADLGAAPLLAGFLATLQVVSSEAPMRGWLSPAMLALAVLCVGCGFGTIRRCLRHRTPLVDLAPFRERNFAIGCWFSFMLGVGLYGATYLLPLFLGLVREHDALEIGAIMIVTGGAQLAAAPVATLLETRLNPMLLTGFGYAMLAAGCLGNGFMTPATDFWGLAAQQAARGIAFMFCLLPTTALALDHLPPVSVPNASGLFNLMRNLGGAVGLALIGSIVETRAPEHAAALVERLQAGDREAARFVGLPLDQFTGQPLGPIDQATRDLVAPMVERAGLTAAFNEAWLLVGGVVLLSLLLLPLLARHRRHPDE